jgi:hypothetical protein
MACSGACAKVRYFIVNGRYTRERGINVMSVTRSTFVGLMSELAVMISL